MNFIARPSVVFLMICCLLPELAFSQAVADKDKRDILKRAEESYYNLPKEGLANFRCAIAPNFEDVVADLRKLESRSGGRLVEAACPDSNHRSGRIGRQGYRQPQRYLR